VNVIPPLSGVLVFDVATLRPGPLAYATNSTAFALDFQVAHGAGCSKNETGRFIFANALIAAKAARRNPREQIMRPSWRRCFPSSNI